MKNFVKDKLGEMLKRNKPWIKEVILRFPKYIQLLVRMITSNYVEDKAKVFILGLLWYFIAGLTGGVFFWIQAVLSFIIGPYAFFPLIVILIIGLDISYSILDADTGFEKEIFGDDKTLQHDIAKLREILGEHYTSIRDWLLRKMDDFAQKMEQEEKIKNGRPDDDFVHETAQKSTEILMKEKFEDIMEKLKQADIEDIEKSIVEFIRKIAPKD
ncbi:MAG: hypothetical protein GY795_17085 [Desulfobacterales bacterium]|nr:hypothetical protein [Desulfobacterales bacterium]